MPWEVEYTQEFEEWWQTPTIREQNGVSAAVDLLTSDGPVLRAPHSSDVRGSRHGRMRELRPRAGNSPLRVFYAFDPLRAAILLIGGDKSGDKGFYWRFIPIADRLYDQHLAELRQEGLIP